MERHQAELLRHQGVCSRLTNQLVVKGSSIKRLMLSSDGCENVIGAKISSRQHAESKRSIRQFSMEPSNVRVGDKAGCINDDFAGIEFRLQNVGENLQ
jgi:hypothetical protein